MAVFLQQEHNIGGKEGNTQGRNNTEIRLESGDI